MSSLNAESTAYRSIEAIAAEHARELFGAPHAYVQPRSCIDANLLMKNHQRPG